MLEHVEGPPQNAIDECRRVLKPGGIVVHTTCFINPIHEAPAVTALHAVRTEASAPRLSEIIEAAGWGSFDVWIAELTACATRRAPLPSGIRSTLAMKNDPAWPIVTWAVARK